MNAYSKFMDISMQDLPEPLTQADQSGFPWLKFAHVAYLLDPEITALSHEGQGVLSRLMAYAAMEVPFSSLPDDMDHLINMAGFKLPEPGTKAFIREYGHAQTVVRAVLNAAFILCKDERYYMPLLANQLTHDSKPGSGAPAGQDSTVPASAEGTGQQPGTPTSGKKLTPAAIRQARWRANKKAKQAGITGESASNVTETVTHNSGVTPDNVTHNAGVTGVTPTVTHNVTNEGGKGGDLDLKQDLDLDLDPASKKNKETPVEPASQPQQPDGPMFFDTPYIGWTPRIDQINVRLQRAGQAPVTEEILLQVLSTFNPHYDDKSPMSDNNRASKLVTWIGDKRIKNQPPFHIPAPAKAKQDPNTAYFGISKDDVVKYARAGETEFDCAKRLANERKQGNKPATKQADKSLPTAGVWSMGEKHTLKQIQQLDTSVIPEHIDAMAKAQDKDRDVVMATLYKTLATNKKEQDLAAAQAKPGAA